MEIEERRKVIQDLYGKKSVKELAEQLQVSVTTIYRDIQALVDEGLLQKKRSKAEMNAAYTENRRKKVKELYLDGKFPYEIAEQLGVALSTIYNDISFLKEEEEIPPLSKRQIEEEQIRKNRRRKVQILYNKGISRREIANELQVAISTVYDDLNELENKGMLIVDQEEEKKRNQEYMKTMQKVKELYLEGKLQSDIADILKISKPKVSSIVRYLRETKKIPMLSKKESEKKEVVTKRRQIIKKLYLEGKKLKK